MATGTGKTLTSAAIIKLFLQTGNARRVLFLVDRIELENQAKKNFEAYLKNDYTTIVYKENRDDWRKAEIVVSTVQSLSYNNKFMKMFSPTDFDLIISDEAHRSINGYKLGLTATPKDYLKKIDAASMSQDDPRQWEQRQLLDTYKTFGCESGNPTFRYSLIDGVRDGFLVNPVVVDARTHITTQLLSDQGYAIKSINDEGNEEEQIFYQKDFERKFFSEETNRIFCKTFMENAKKDPISGEIGKTIVFCVSRKHASRITQILNEFADKVYPNKYNSDFAIQITSDIPDAQQFTINFANNNLSGHTGFLEDYKSAKTRVCITVGMMTTGYDCEDLLNVVLLRPIFSPTDFIQIKGRGTRKYTFTYKLKENAQVSETNIEKETFKLFDFFANCEYFEEKFNYDEIIELPKGSSIPAEGGGGTPKPTLTYNTDPDPLMFIAETPVGEMGMKIDRKLYEKFEETVKNDDFVRQQYEEGNIAAVESYIRENIFNKPHEYYDMDKLRIAAGVDRRITLSEVLDKIFGRIEWFKNKNELLEDEFEKYVLTNRITSDDYYLIKNFFKAYIVDRELRNIIDDKQFALLATNAHMSMNDIRKLGSRVKDITDYIKDNVKLSKFTA